jgi:hypothetical protein
LNDDRTDILEGRGGNTEERRGGAKDTDEMKDQSMGVRDGKTKVTTFSGELSYELKRHAK